MTATQCPQSYQILRFDDFLAPDEAARTIHEVDALPWTFGWKSSKQMPGSHWHVDFDGGNTGKQEESIEARVDHPIAHRLWARASGGPMCGHTLVRAYANAHTYGVGGNPHLDRKEDGYWTMVYYPLEEWQPSWCGETVLFDHTGDIVYASLPRPNRAIVFPANMMHAARAVDRTCYRLRTCVVLKTKAPK